MEVAWVLEEKCDSKGFVQSLKEKPKMASFADSDNFILFSQG